ncbi:MAG TPA: sterol desaturase family protein [Gemmatimonadales bacterium]|nr:sterol desaturase family protein [Gemmatimonadales bacterium]
MSSPTRGQEGESPIEALSRGARDREDRLSPVRQASAAWIAVAGLLIAVASLWALRTTGTISSDLDAFAAWCGTTLPGLPVFLQGYFDAAARTFLLNPVFYVALATIFALERLIPAKPGQRIFSVGLAQDFLWFGLDGAMRLALIPVYAALLQAVYSSYLSWLTLDIVATWPAPAPLIASFLLIDFLAWAHHFVRHKVSVFWYFHTIHHSQREMNLFTDLRVHVAERIISLTLTFIPLSMLQIGMPTDLYVAVALNWYTRAYHANLRTNYGFLKHVLVTPQSHRIHHSIEPRHQDKNFGVIFTFWDRLFGTLYAHYDEYPETGIADGRFPLEQQAGARGIFRSLAAQFCYPFRLLLGRRSTGTA